jgi:hypothetical protein
MAVEFGTFIFCNTLADCTSFRSFGPWSVVLTGTVVLSLWESMLVGRGAAWSRSSQTTDLLQFAKQISSF